MNDVQTIDSAVVATVDDGMTTFHNGIFGNVRVVDHRNAPWFIAKDICDALEVKNTAQALIRLDDDEKDVILNDTPGGTQETSVVNEPGMYSLVLSSRKKEAREFKRWITHEVIPAIRATGKYDIRQNNVPAVIADDVRRQGNDISDIKAMLQQSGIFDVFTNPRYSFYQYRYFYVTTTGDDSPRGFYDSIADYTGIVVPMSYNIKTTVIEWILNNIPMDYIKEFALGVKAGSIVRSDEGHWVNLNGYDSGCGVEWEKTKRFFGNRCAYCGEEAPLVPEHIVPQTVMSTVDPRRVDLVGSNVICSCSRCNGEKKASNMEEWFRHSKHFSKYRLGKIHEFQRMYRISELPE